MDQKVHQDLQLEKWLEANEKIRRIRAQIQVQSSSEMKGW